MNLRNFRITSHLSYFLEIDNEIGVTGVWYSKNGKGILLGTGRKIVVT